MPQERLLKSNIREDKHGNKILGKRLIKKPQRFEPENSQSDGAGFARSGHVIRLRNLASASSQRELFGESGKTENEQSSKVEKGSLTVKIMTRP